MLRVRQQIAVALFLTSLTVAPVRAEVVIAVVGPISGQLAPLGEQVRRGAEMAVKDLNLQGGVLNKKVSLIVSDDACDPARAVKVARNLANKKVNFVAGHLCSSSSISASAVYAENGILMISPVSTSPALTDAAFNKGWKNVFRVSGRDDAQGIVAGKFIASKFKGQKVAIIHDMTDYGKGLAEKARENLRAAGGKEVLYEAYTPGKKDYSKLISRMKATGVTAFYLGGHHVEAGLMIRQAHEQDYKPRLISGDVLVTEEFWKISGPAGEGTIMTYLPDQRKKLESRDVVARFRKQKFDPEGYTLYAYAAVQVWAEAAKRAKSLKMAAISNAIRGASYETVIGKLSFDGKGDVKNPEYVWYVWKGGKYSEQ